VKARVAEILVGMILVGIILVGVILVGTAGRKGERIALVSMLSSSRSESKKKQSSGGAEKHTWSRALPLL
jgi:hypothetical protein